MGNQSLDDLSRQQREIIEIIWELGEATVHQVRDRLTMDKDLAYTSVLSVMQKLEKLGWLRHRSAGRTYVYLPARSRDAESAHSLRNLVRQVFGGSPLAAFQTLLREEKLTDEELMTLRKMIDRRRKEQGHE